MEKSMGQATLEVSTCIADLLLTNLRWCMSPALLCTCILLRRQLPTSLTQDKLKVVIAYRPPSLYGQLHCVQLCTTAVYSIAASSGSLCHGVFVVQLAQT